MSDFNIHEWQRKRLLSEGRGEDMADKVISQLREKVFKTLDEDELDTFKKRLLKALLLDSEYKKLYEGLNDNMSLKDIARELEKENPQLRFDVNTQRDRIEVRGSQQDLFDFGTKMQGQTFGEYEVFAIDDDERGETVRVVKSDSIMRESKKKDDRCTRIAKRKYDTWPSAYASGAVVRCRKGEIWKDEK